MTERESTSRALAQINREKKQNILKYGTARWYKLKNKYGLREIANQNNIILFELNNIPFYFALRKQKVRKKGAKDWHSKIETYLKAETGCAKLPETQKKTDYKKTDYKKTDLVHFGKYANKITWDQLKIENESYITNYLIPNSTDKPLVKFLKQLYK